MSSDIVRLRRSFLYVAPFYADILADSRSLAADIICYDLEDATPPAAKIASRAVIADHLADRMPRAAERLVRVNALDTEWGHEDLRFAATLPIGGVLLPKVEGDASVRQARAVLTAAGRPDVAIWCLIETPLGVLRVEQIACAGGAGLVVGGVDLAEGLHARAVPSRLPLWHALSQVVLAARAFGIAAIDAVAAGPPDVVEAGCRQTIELGFDGKAVFNRAGVEIVNRMFAPDEEEIARARAALEGAVGYGAHVDHARRVLAYAALVEIAEQEILE
jgi:citrate lyase subunit beta/citryl-CoA lyase